MYEAGLLSMGALAIILLAFGWAAWFFRGHRGDLSGIAVRREWLPFDRKTDVDLSREALKAQLAFSTSSFGEDMQLPAEPRASGARVTLQHGNRTHDARERTDEDE